MGPLLMLRCTYQSGFSLSARCHISHRVELIGERKKKYECLKKQKTSPSQPFVLNLTLDMYSSCPKDEEVD